MSIASTRSTARPSAVRAPSVALLPCGLDRGGGLSRRHATARDFRRDVIDDATDRWTETLVIEVLVIVRLRQIVGDLFHEGVVEAGFAALDHGDEEAGGGKSGLHVLRNEELEEIGGFLRRALGNEPTRDAAERIGRLALAAGHDRKVEPADLVLGQTDLVGGERALQIVDRADGERHRGLAVAEIAD